MILYCSSSFTACIIVEFVNHWVPVDRAFQKLGTQMILVFFLSRCVCIQHHANVDSKKHIKAETIPEEVHLHVYDYCRITPLVLDH